MVIVVLQYLCDSFHVFEDLKTICSAYVGFMALVKLLQLCGPFLCFAAIAFYRLFLFKHFHNLFIIVSKLLQVWPRFYVFATIALLVSSWLQTFSYQIYNFHCSTFLTKIGAALVHFDVFF